MARKELSFEDYWALRQCGIRCTYVSYPSGEEWPDAMYIDKEEDEKITEELFSNDVRAGGKYVIEVE